MNDKKIYSITSVRNEADIIESFVRYTVNIVDGMVINENCSTDNTLDILKKLKKEGLNIDIIEDKDVRFSQVEKTEELVNYTMKKYNPDWLLSLDADEFIFLKDYSNPRDLIQKLDPDTVNRFQWVTYIVTGKEGAAPFVPGKIQYIRNYEKEEYKAIMSKRLYETDAHFFKGAHDIALPTDLKKNEVILTELQLAHFPIRSVEQLTTKAIIGVLNKFSHYSRSSGTGYHQISIFDEIIKKGSLDNNDLIRDSLYYAVKDDALDISIEHRPMGFEFCKDINIKYKKEAETNLLGISLQTAESIITDLREKKEQLEINTNSEEINALRQALQSSTEELKQIKSNKAWQITKKITTLFSHKSNSPEK